MKNLQSQMLFYPKKGITLVCWIFSPDGSGISRKIKQGNRRRFISREYSAQQERAPINNR
jgi:hypothetical protein